MDLIPLRAALIRACSYSHRCGDPQASLTLAAAAKEVGRSQDITALLRARLRVIVRQNIDPDLRLKQVDQALAQYEEGIVLEKNAFPTEPSQSESKAA